MACAAGHSAIPYDAGNPRSSHFESAQEANDIYNLYGRDSWASDSQAGLAFSPNHTSHPLPHSMHGNEQEELEELEGGDYADEDEVYATPRPLYDNAFDYVSVPPAHQRSSPGANGAWNGNRDHDDDDDDWAPEEFPRPSTAQDFTRQDDEWSVGGQSETGHNAHAQGMGIGQAFTHDYAHPTESYAAQPHNPHQLAQAWTATPVEPPVVSVEEGTSSFSRTTSSRTPPRTPELVVHQSPDGPADDMSRRTSSSAVPSRLRSELPPQTPPQRLSPTESSANSPVHPSITRIAHSPRNGLPSSAESSVAGMSNASLVSSQYPGEETDAYHVRSTCECPQERVVLMHRRAPRD